MNLENKESAFRGLAYQLRAKHDVFYFSNEFNNGKHALFTPPITCGELPRYYALFKKDFFMTFGVQFSNFIRVHPEASLVGESINVDWLKTAIASKVDYLLFIYDNGKVYAVSPKAVENFCIKHNLVRTQDVTNKTSNFTIRETTYSFPITLLKRWGDI